MAPHSQSKAQPAPVVRPPVVQPAPVDEEDIDLDDVSETSNEEDTPPAPANIPDATTHVAPITKPVMKSNRALDIDLLLNVERESHQSANTASKLISLVLLINI